MRGYHFTRRTKLLAFFARIKFVLLLLLVLVLRGVFGIMISHANSNFLITLRTLLLWKTVKQFDGNCAFRHYFLIYVVVFRSAKIEKDIINCIAILIHIQLQLEFFLGASKCSCATSFFNTSVVEELFVTGEFRFELFKVGARSRMVRLLSSRHLRWLMLDRVLLFLTGKESPRLRSLLCRLRRLLLGDARQWLRRIFDGFLRVFLSDLFSGF